MTGKERMWAATVGAPVDHVPIWLREGFSFEHPLPAADDFAQGWRAEPDYAALWEFARHHCDTRGAWSPGGHFNRLMAIPSRYIRHDSQQVDADTRRTITRIQTPKGELVGVDEQRRGIETTWRVKEFVETIEDFEKLRSVPFEVSPVSYDGYERSLRTLGDRGVTCLGISSPWVVVTACMSYQQALAWSALERNLLLESIEEVTERILACLRVVCQRPLDTIANMGGCEQCTPPMMSPDAFAEFVTPYDGRIVAFLKEHGIPCNCHCHGFVRNALPEMIRAGFESTDPVEEAGRGGDLTIAEARAIAGDRLTLVGNLEFNELETLEPRQIRARVREILDSGKRRLILSASAGPISKMTPRLIANYYAWIEEAVSCGGCSQ